jgi:hypothetical protein
MLDYFESLYQLLSFEMKRADVKKGFRKLDNMELHNVCFCLTSSRKSYKMTRRYRMHGNMRIHTIF